MIATLIVEYKLYSTIFLTKNLSYKAKISAVDFKKKFWYNNYTKNRR